MNPSEQLSTLENRLLAAIKQIENEGGADLVAIQVQRYTKNGNVEAWKIAICKDNTLQDTKMINWDDNIKFSDLQNPEFVDNLIENILYVWETEWDTVL